MTEFLMNFGSWIWLAVMVVFIIIEACTLALTTVWAAIAALPMIFISRTGLAFKWQLLIFVILTLLLVFSTRPFAIKKLKVGKNQTNVNVLEGQEVLVTKSISKFQKGEVKATNGVVWAAKSKDDSEILEGTVCRVVAVEGNTLIIESKA